MADDIPGMRDARASGAIEEVLVARRKALADLMHAQAIGQGDVQRAVHQITETAAHIVGVNRASVWRLVEDGGAIECIDLYERTSGRHSAGIRIPASEAPRYFEALQRERTLCTNDAGTDARTNEFYAGYLEPLGITAMLDAPIFVRGKMVGVVCHEHTGGPRHWTFSEELLAGTFADFVALVLETSSWHEAEKALRFERDALEGKVEERTHDLRESEANLRELLELSPVAMVLTKITDNTVAFANRRASEMFEVPLEIAEGQNAPDFWVVPADRQLFLANLQREGRVDKLEVQMKTRTGRVFWSRLSATKIRFRGDDTLLGAMVDITDQKEAQERLRELATRDALTGTYNRGHLEEVVRHELDRSVRYTRPLTIAMLDADHFKRVNDTYGHAVGDRVLRALADRCRKTLRSNDVLGRYGGEEFVVVFPETSLDDASIVAERIRTAVAQTPVTFGDGAIEITVSIGLATSTPGQRLESLMGAADTALYAAKRDGRNLVRRFG
jgi:diguanylate cyclase (GGDEF)-like protein/PAS domain S-box-containing protein